MKLVNSIDVVCQAGVVNYYKGRELHGGVIDRIEDHSWEHVDGTVDNLILLYSGEKIVCKLVNVPMVIEYEKVGE
jgi:hypothetical protein